MESNSESTSGKTAAAEDRTFAATIYNNPPKPAENSKDDDRKISSVNPTAMALGPGAEKWESITQALDRLKTAMDIEAGDDVPEVESDSDSDDDTIEPDLRSNRNIFFHLGYIFPLVCKEHARVQRRAIERKVARRQRRAAAQSNETGLLSLEEKSTEAYLRGAQAGLSWVEWSKFIAPKGGYEETFMTPIDIVIGEPEPRTILLLGKGPTNPQTSKDRLSELPQAEAADIEQLSLPERIKVHSRPLFKILKTVFKGHVNWKTANDGSMVFLRPFKEMLYYDVQLRETLANLEAHPALLKKAHGKESPEPSAESAGQETEAGPAQDPDGAETMKETGTSDSKTDEGAQRHSAEESNPHPVTALLHLRCLVNFIDKELNPKIEYINSGGCRRIYFHDLLHLFRPGNEVVDQSEKQAYRVVRVEAPRHEVEEPFQRWYDRGVQKKEKEEPEPEEDTLVKIHCAYIDFDGKRFGSVSVKFCIPLYHGLKEIKSLPVYPLRYAMDGSIRDTLIQRGKMLLEVSSFKSMYYSGVTLDSREEIDSQVVVDFSEALAGEERELWRPKIDSLRTAPDPKDSLSGCGAPCCLGQAVSEDQYIETRLTEDFVRSLVPDDQSIRAPSLLLSPRLLEETQIGSENEPTDEELVVMTYRVFAFVLRSRKWAQLDLSSLRHENKEAREFTLSAFDHLALPEGHLDLVRSLVTQHFRNRATASARDEQTDLIRGKGKGLIMLLHGAPGVGKTTTAEGVAEHFEKPLFQITCGDLGNTARQVEQELEKNFALASRWGCILLLDEADVFLSARERKDFERNGLVAVFLRVLEYYAGILFLTTNRIGDIDEAFASRIHMSLYYPHLDEENTKKIFALNLKLIRDRFNRQKRKITCDASSIASFAAQHYKTHQFNRWNGRQIRNLCQTALALAEYDAHQRDVDGRMKADVMVHLQLKYFETVQKAYIEFGVYLGEVRGTQGDRRAYDNQVRSRQDTPYETTPSKFSTRRADPRRDVGHTASDSQSSSQGDVFQPLVNQSYTTRAGPNSFPGNDQYYQSGQTGNLGMSAHAAHQGYVQQTAPAGHADPRFFPVQPTQLQPQMGYGMMQQNWTGANMHPNYYQAGQSVPLQQAQGGVQMMPTQQPQALGPQGQMLQMDSSYGIPSQGFQQGGVQVSNQQLQDPGVGGPGVVVDVPQGQ